jgi:AraC family transcriptional regulator
MKGRSSLAEGSLRQLISPNDRGEFRKFWPRRRRNVLSGGELVLENHYVTGRSEFEAPGMTHHMLIIPLRAHTPMRFGWSAATFEGIFRTGDQILLPAGEPSHCRFDRIDDALVAHFQPEYLRRLLESEWGVDPAKLSIGCDLWFQNSSLVDIGRMMRDALSLESGHRLLLESLGTAAGMLLLNSDRSLKGHRPHVERRGELPALSRVLDYMNCHFADDVGLAELAAVAGCSLQHFKRAFKVSTGIPPHRFLLSIRIKHSQALLVKNGLALAQIALECGFSSQSHFSSAFRRYTGVSPARWQRTALS